MEIFERLFVNFQMIASESYSGARTNLSWFEVEGLKLGIFLFSKWISRAAWITAGSKSIWNNSCRGKKTELLTFIWREWTKIKESQPIMMFHLLVHDRTFFLNSCGWDSISIKSFWTEQCDAWTESALRVLCQFRLRWDHEIYKEFEFRSWNKPHQRIT